MLSKLFNEEVFLISRCDLIAPGIHDLAQSCENLALETIEFIFSE